MNEIFMYVLLCYEGILSISEIFCVKSRAENSGLWYYTTVVSLCIWWWYLMLYLIVRLLVDHLCTFRWNSGRR